MDINPEIIGSVAAILTTAAYIPQTYKVLSTRQTGDLSLGMYLMITTGIFGWFLYGLLIDSPSVIWANGASFIMALIILVMKIKHG